MKTLGIIGGLGPESTLDYYRRLVAVYRRRTGDGTYPRVIINCVDLSTVVAHVTAQRHAELAAFLVTELKKLSEAGVDVALIAANTPHIVFDQVRAQSPLPLISIVEATCRAARARHLSRVALFGTRFTMQGQFYPAVFAGSGVALVVPTPDEQATIHDIYMDELVHGVVLRESHATLLLMVERMKTRHDIDGLILGGTELSLILLETEHAGVAFLDTTTIHVEEAVELMLA